MAGNTMNSTAAVVAGIDAGTVYSDFIEPILCVLYAFVIAKIACSASDDLKGPFFSFAITTGASAILNILCNLFTRLFDLRFHVFPDRGLFMNILSCFSHTFAFSMTLGKILAVATRFSSVWFPFSFKRFWCPSHIRIIITLQFLLPLVIFAYMPFMTAAFARTDDGYGHYLGIESVPFKIAKGFNMFVYFIFFVTTIPMCVATVAKLVMDRKKIALMQGGWTASGATISRSERILVLCSVVLTLAHAVKATQQTIWFLALIMNESGLQATMISLYMIPNAVTSFAEPVLLLISSKALRREIFGMCTTKEFKETNTTRVASFAARSK